MGAEPWSNYTPFQPDVSKALHDLQDEVFARGEFDKPSADIDFLDAMNFFDATDEEREEMISQYGLSVFSDPIKRMGISEFRNWLFDLNSAPSVETREELRVLNCLSSDGTRSILDMLRTVPEPEFGCICPLPASDLLRIFGTERPTREMVEEKRMDLYEGIPRGQGIYLLLYAEDKPGEIFFAGYSFD